MPVVSNKLARAFSPALVGGPLLVTAVVEVHVGALVEALPDRHRPPIVIVWEGVVQAVVPVPGPLVGHCQATCVAVSQLGRA